MEKKIIEKTMAKMEYQSITLNELLGRSLNDIEQKNVPKTLYYKGVMQIPLKCAGVSVIGTREPTNKGISTAKEIVKTLVKKNVIIVSGLAKGIDSVGHKTAIENNGKTIAVIGTPLDKTYPKENTTLQKEIMEKHLVVSQYPIGYPTRKQNFMMRNRTMALISDASVIVEAKDTSGTMYQGWEALRLGRPLYICESVTNDPKLTWPKKMIDYGAMVLYDPVDILEVLPSHIKISELFQ